MRRCRGGWVAIEGGRGRKFGDESVCRFRCSRGQNYRFQSVENCLAWKEGCAFSGFWWGSQTSLLDNWVRVTVRVILKLAWWHRELVKDFCHLITAVARDFGAQEASWGLIGGERCEMVQAANAYRTLASWLSAHASICSIIGGGRISLRCRLACYWLALAAVSQHVSPRESYRDPCIKEGGDSFGILGPTSLSLSLSLSRFRSYLLVRRHPRSLL